MTSLKLVNNWRKEKSVAQGGDSFLCPRCAAPRFVSVGSKPDSVLFCSRARAARSDAKQRQSDGLSDASPRPSTCLFAARARKWRAQPKAKAGAGGDASHGGPSCTCLARRCPRSARASRRDLLSESVHRPSDAGRSHTSTRPSCKSGRWCTRRSGQQLKRSSGGAGRRYHSRIQCLRRVMVGKHIYIYI